MADHEGSDDQVVALGGGRGLACLIRALRGGDRHLTVIASILAEAGDDDARRDLTGPVGDLRRSLEALSDENGALLHAMRRPLTVAGVGQRPLGDLTLTAVADALGGYGRASMWLGDQLGIDGAVLPATVAPAKPYLEDIASSAPGEADAPPVRRLRFAEGTPGSPEAAVTAIRTARWVLLAPGRLYEHILSTCAVPDLAAALTSTSAHVIWIASLTPAPRESPHLTGTEHVQALRLHGVRVDAVLHDPAATLAFDAGELAAIGVKSVTRPLRSASDPGTHDPELLHAALTELLSSGALEQPAA